MSVTDVCNVAKWYVLPKYYLKKQTGLPDCYHVVPIQTPYNLPFFSSSQIWVLWHQSVRNEEIAARTGLPSPLYRPPSVAVAQLFSDT